MRQNQLFSMKGGLIRNYKKPIKIRIRPPRSQTPGEKVSLSRRGIASGQRGSLTDESFEIIWIEVCQFSPELEAVFVATTSTPPPGKTRDSVSRAISTTRTDPSGMATGPSGNCNPLAMILTGAPRSAIPTSSETKPATLEQAYAPNRETLILRFLEATVLVLPDASGFGVVRRSMILSKIDATARIKSRGLR
jgi:hypothetical protein